MMIFQSTFVVCAVMVLFLANSAIGEKFCLGERDPNGVLYQGKLSKTRSGLTCQRWDSDELHNQTHWPENSTKHHNYCRNPNPPKEKPWCYTNTTNANISWDYCSVRICPSVCGVQGNAPAFLNQRFLVANGKVLPRRRVTRVIGGDNAVHGSWPWMVSIRIQEKNRCGGALIRTSWVLTASHCADYIDISQMIVMAGHHFGSEPQSQARRVERFFKHPRYFFFDVVHDIGLIKLKSPFRISNHVRLVCLPPPGYIVRAQTYCIGSGWGDTNEKNRRSQLKQAVLPVHSYGECLKVMGKDMKDRTQMCAGWKAEGHDTCKGDSGGPLVCLVGKDGNNARWTVQGVTAWSYSSCEHKGGFGAYTRVSKYISWMNRIMTNFGKKVG